MKKQTTLLFMLIGCLLLAACTAQYESYEPPQTDPAIMLNKLANVREEAQVIENPGRQQGTWTSKDGKLTLVLNAEVAIPDTDCYPVIELVPRTIDEEWVQDIVETFAQGETVYQASTITEENTEDGSSVYLNQFREDAEALLDFCLNLTDKEQEDLNRIKAEDEDSYQLALELLASHEEYARSILGAMPKGYVPDLAQNFQLTLMDEEEFIQSSGMLREYMVKLNGDFASYIIFAQRNLPGIFVEFINEGFRSYPFAISYTLNESDISNTSLSYQDAYSMATQLMSSLGIDYMELSFSGAAQSSMLFDLPIDERGIYRFVFVRKEGELQEEYMQLLSFTQSYEYDKTTWAQEMLLIDIDDQGVRRCIWSSPSEKISIRNPNVELLPVSDILDFVREECPEYFHYKCNTGSSQVVSDTITITGIELGLCKILDPENDEKYLLIPAWNLTGHLVRQYQEGSTDASILGDLVDENGQYSETFDRTCCITINAIDGSIIERMPIPEY